MHQLGVYAEPSLITAAPENRVVKILETWLAAACRPLVCSFLVMAAVVPSSRGGCGEAKGFAEHGLA